MQLSTISQLGPEIRRMRRELGLSQVDLSVATGLSIKFISQLETGKADNPSLANALDIITALGGRLVIDWNRSADATDRPDAA